MGESEMLDNQDIINEINKLPQLEKEITSLILLELMKLQIEVEKLKHKIKAYETKQDI